MPIPAFDNILNVLPPHLGDPTDPAHLSPYPCTMLELCNHFNTSPKRKQILQGLLGLRNELFALNLSGFQWLDGSFLEDIESQEGRDPGDIDVVTFVDSSLSLNDLANLINAANRNLLNPHHVKATYFVDHFLVSLSSASRLLVSTSRYWYGLFSHRRDRTWKGMLTVELLHPNDDAAANKALGAGP